LRWLMPAALGCAKRYQVFLPNLRVGQATAHPVAPPMELYHALHEYKYGGNPTIF
jgi:hypothetical protein